MATMYFAKVNVNSDIYDIYEDKNKLYDILSDLLININDKDKIVDKHPENDKQITIQFSSLSKSENCIYGRLVYYFDGINITFNKEKREIEEAPQENMAQYITFYFDVMKERIAFTYKKEFGRRMFIDYFEKMLNHFSSNDVIFEIYLEKNIKDLENKIRYYSKINEVEISVIPPNGDKEDFDNLFGNTSEDIKETNATKFYIRLQSAAKEGINVLSKMLQNSISIIGKGYGDIVFKGKDKANNKYTVTSSEQALYVKPIKDEYKDNLIEFPEIARSGINNLLSEKDRVVNNEKE